MSKKNSKKCLPPTVKIAFDQVSIEEVNKISKLLDQMFTENGWKFVSRVRHNDLVFIKYYKKGD